MKNANITTKIPHHRLAIVAAGLLAAAFGAASALGDIVYVTSTCSNVTATSICGSTVNLDLNANGISVYSDGSLGAFTSAVSAKQDGPVTPGGRYFSNAFSNTTPDAPGIIISPSLGVTGGIYKVYHVFSSAAGNVSTNIVVGVTNVEGCTLSFTQTTKFQSAYGTAVSGKNVYQLLGFVTNNADSASPRIGFYFVGGLVSAGASARLVVDTFKFRLYDPCSDTTDLGAPGVTGPLAAGLTSVTVTGVTNTATKVTVYQDSGSGMTQIGSSTGPFVTGNNSVSVSGLVKGAIVGATQTVNGQEGCIPTGGTVVGGGANPPVRVALTIRETTSTGPVGDPGVSTSANLHFLGASALSGGAPIDAAILYPSNGWQTVTFPGRGGIAGPATASGTVADSTGFGYAANDAITLRVYATKTVLGVMVFSATPAQSSAVTSNNAYIVNWTWDPVPGADGYRLLRDVNGAGYNDFVDVVGDNNFNDQNVSWSGGNTVTPTLVQTTPSIEWNGAAVGTTNAIATQWGILESINFAVADSPDTGPYDIYIDNIQNGATVFQNFEKAPAVTTDYGFRAPSFSGTTSGNILALPNTGTVANNIADTGTKSFHIQYQWQATNATKWLRLTTSGVNNPQVNLDDAISFRILMQPVGATPPAPPAAPTLTAAQVGGKTVLSWVGGHRLQTCATNVAGVYTNVPQALSPNTWTNITLGGFLSPWTNTLADPMHFYRLRD